MTAPSGCSGPLRTTSKSLRYPHSSAGCRCPRAHARTLVALTERRVTRACLRPASPPSNHRVSLRSLRKPVTHLQLAIADGRCGGTGRADALLPGERELWEEAGPRGEDGGRDGPDAVELRPGRASRRRYCHSVDDPSRFLLKRLLNGEGCSGMTELSPTARSRPRRSSRTTSSSSGQSRRIGCEISRPCSRPQPFRQQHADPTPAPS